MAPRPSFSRTVKQRAARGRISEMFEPTGVTRPASGRPVWPRSVLGGRRKDYETSSVVHPIVATNNSGFNRNPRVTGGRVPPALSWRGARPRSPRVGGRPMRRVCGFPPARGELVGLVSVSLLPTRCHGPYSLGPLKVPPKLARTQTTCRTPTFAMSLPSAKWGELLRLYPSSRSTASAIWRAAG